MLKPLDIYVLVALLALPRRDGWTQAAFGQEWGSRSLPGPALCSGWRRRAPGIGRRGRWRSRARKGCSPTRSASSSPRASARPRAASRRRARRPPLASELVANDALVWPDDEGTATGTSLAPLHPAAPAAARRNPRLHEMLALVDALRVGRVRERTLAARRLHERIAKAE